MKFSVSKKFDLKRYAKHPASCYVHTISTKLKTVYFYDDYTPNYYVLVFTFVGPIASIFTLPLLFNDNS